MRETAWAVLVVVAMTTAGCLGSVSGAEVSQATLDDNGWSKTKDESSSVAMGLGELVTKDYRPNRNVQGTGAIVASSNDVPILDETRFIPDAIEKVEQRRNIDLKKSGTTTVSLPELGAEQVEAQLYTFQKAGASGKAILFTPDDCGPFVVTVGYGITGAAGISGVEKTYQEAKDVARGVVCG